MDMYMKLSAGTSISERYQVVMLYYMYLLLLNALFLCKNKDSATAIQCTSNFRPLARLFCGHGYYTCCDC